MAISNLKPQSQQDPDANGIIMVASITVGIGTIPTTLIPLPRADIPIMASAWTGMAVELAKLAGTKLSKGGALKIIAAALSSGAWFCTGLSVAERALAWNPCSAVFVMSVRAATNAGTTYFAGKAMANAFLASDKGESAEEILKSVFHSFAGHQRRIPPAKCLAR